MELIGRRNIKITISGILVLVLTLLLTPLVNAATESGSVGLEGRINSAPPTQGATISFPRDGAVISNLPVTVTGVCPNGLLVKIFKNNVFAGSAQCTNGSYSIQIDLFSGRNELVARVYDDLDQPGPDSNMVAVTFPANATTLKNRVSLTSSFAKKGANPGQTLTWPIVISGGDGPYAVSVDWGDGKTPDIISQQFAGTFNITHIYDTPGVYNIIVRATDSKGAVAFLQLVGVGNGPLSQSNQGGDGQGGTTEVKQGPVKVLWQPAAIAIPLIVSTFWLGKRYELYVLRKRLEQHENLH